MSIETGRKYAGEAEIPLGQVTLGSILPFELQSRSQGMSSIIQRDGVTVSSTKTMADNGP